MICQHYWRLSGSDGNLVMCHHCGDVDDTVLLICFLQKNITELRAKLEVSEYARDMHLAHLNELRAEKLNVCD